ncbi:hypothetical protein B0F90DRAFT_1741135 [Multifurca ochricompacta]|uniref:Uncharacterized protein n=1 Tax=Multifurca ochricompacta TaxID=376703 RepID=A0AAD4M0R2_9AGAM|nr:hypothetical protein B0F90DRAFT_1741135 [Multifurca ochricompacta]
MKGFSSHTTTAILIQVKNDKAFQCNINSYLFDDAEPFHVGLFPAGHTPLPVIQAVFMLASSEAAVLIPVAPQRKNHYDPLTYYDMWCGGVSGDRFKDIDRDLHWYQNFLQCDVQPPKTYEFKVD